VTIAVNIAKWPLSSESKPSAVGLGANIADNRHVDLSNRELSRCRGWNVIGAVSPPRLAGWRGCTQRMLIGSLLELGG